MSKMFEAFEMTSEAHFLVGNCPECGAPKYQWTKSVGVWTCPKCRSTFPLDGEAVANPAVDPVDDMIDDTVPPEVDEEVPEEVPEEEATPESLPPKMTPEEAEDAQGEPEEPKEGVSSTDEELEESIQREGYFDKRMEIDDDPTGEHQDTPEELNTWLSKHPKIEGEHEDGYKSPTLKESYMSELDLENREAEDLLQSDEGLLDEEESEDRYFCLDCEHEGPISELDDSITCPECGSDNLEVTYDSDEEVADYEDYDSDDIEGDVDSYDDLAEGPDVGEDLHESWGHAGGPPKPEDYDDDESFEAAQDSYDSWVEHELDARKDEPRESRAKSGFNEAFVFKPGEGGDWGNIEEVPNEQKVDYEALPSEPTEEHTYRTRIIHNGVGETREFKAMSSKEAMVKVAKWLFSGQVTDNGIIGEGGSVRPFSARNLGEFFTMHRMSGNPEQVVWIKNQDTGLYVYDQEGKQFTQKQQYKREARNRPFHEAEDDVGNVDKFPEPEGVESKVFDQSGTFSALHAALNWLQERGYSVGRLCNDAPIGFKQGEWDISKWWNLSSEDKGVLDGAVISDDFRSGPVTVMFGIEKLNKPQQRSDDTPVLTLKPWGSAQ